VLLLLLLLRPLLSLLLGLQPLLLILPPPSLQRLLLRPSAMLGLLLPLVTICPPHCRSLRPSHCLVALLLLPQPPLQDLSPLLHPLLLLLLLPPTPLPLQPKLRLQLLPGSDGLCP